MYCVCGAPRESNYARHDIPHSQTCAQSDPRVGMTPDPPVIEAMILKMEGEKEITRGRTEKHQYKRQQFAQQTGCGVNVVHKMDKTELMEHLSN